MKFHFHAPIGALVLYTFRLFKLGNGRIKFVEAEKVRRLGSGRGAKVAIKEYIFLYILKVPPPS